MLFSNNIKFQTCVKAAEAYAAMAKLTRVCPKEVYDQKMQSLEAPSDLISTLCGSFNAQICVTDSISTYWNQLATQFNGKAIGDTIEQNFNTAVNQLSSIAKSVGQSLNEQRIPERFASGLESIQNTFNDRAKEVSKVVAPSRDVNRYSIVGEKDPAASGVDELVDSFFPSVEIVQKEPAVPVEDTTTTTKKVISSAPNRFPFMDWFQSGYERASTFMKGIGKGAAGGVNSGPETPKGSDNPYSNNPQ